ncbi:MAG: O-antigen ligase family protein [Clostridia bacterium]|nr:O-antigen ligase family protein [Clostridia bacterium]
MTNAITLEKIKTGFNNYQSFIKKFVYTDFYLALVCLVVFLGWVTKCAPLGITGAVILACLALLGADDILPFTVNIFSTVLLVYSYDFSDYTKMWPLAFPLGICLVIFIIKNGRHKFTLGKMFFPLLAVAYALFLGGVGTLIKQDFIRALPDSIMLGLGVPAIYLIYNHFLKRDKRRDVPMYFGKTMMYIGLVMCIQLIIVIIQKNKPLHQWHEIVWNVGWANRNGLATYLIFTAGMTMYLSTRYRQGWIFLGLSIFQYGCLIMTFSRGGIIFGGISGVVALIFSIIKAPNKKLHLLYIATAVLVVLILYLCLMKEVNTMLASLVDRGFGTSNRNKLYEEAWELFKAHPLFGVGKGYKGDLTPTSEIGIYWFHSTFFQVIACMGVMGLVAYIYFYAVRIKILFKNIKNTFNLFCLAVFIGFEGYSLINTGTFVAFPYMALVITMTLLLERTQDDYSGYVTPYNYSTPWGDKIVQKEIEFIEKFRVKEQENKQRRKTKKLPEHASENTKPFDNQEIEQKHKNK